MSHWGVVSELHHGNVMSCLTCPTDKLKIDMRGKCYDEPFRMQLQKISSPVKAACERCQTLMRGTVATLLGCKPARRSHWPLHHARRGVVVTGGSRGNIETVKTLCMKDCRVPLVRFLLLTIRQYCHFSSVAALLVNPMLRGSERPL